MKIDKEKETLLLEAQMILMDSNQRAYYQTLQTHLSELMVASLGIGSVTMLM